MKKITKNSVKHEKSCGAVIFRKHDNVTLYLTVEYKKEPGYWGLVKGHVEAGETEHETARREIWEETGLKALTFINGFRAEITYSPKPGVEKLVVFFLVQTESDQVEYLWDEHINHNWLPAEAMAKKLTYPGDRSVVAKAQAFLAENE